MSSPIFIIGNPRSGTTLLRLMLTCHPAIVIPPEGAFAVWLCDQYRDWVDGCDAATLARFVEDLFASRKFDTWGVDRCAFTEYLTARAPDRYVDAVAAVYEYYGTTHKPGFRRWGDKNNWYVEKVDTIARMFPAASFVHIVRDCRNVACSYRKVDSMRLTSAYAPRLPTRVADVAREWSRNIRGARRSFAGLNWENVSEVRFETLLREPEPTLRTLCNELGEPYHPQMLQYHRINRDEQLEPKELMAWKEKTLEPPSTAEIEKYKSELSREEIEEMETIAGDEMRLYGYSG